MVDDWQKTKKLIDSILPLSCYCNFNLTGAAVPIPEKEESVPESSSNAGKIRLFSSLGVYLI